jgi:hypothetical protein
MLHNLKYRPQTPIRVTRFIWNMFAIWCTSEQIPLKACREGTHRSLAQIFLSLTVSFFTSFLFYQVLALLHPFLSSFIFTS